MSMFRLTRGHVIAAVAALVLMLVTALDWYSTAEGEENRRIERLQGEPSGGESGQISREVRESASITAEEQERNAWDPEGVVDVLVLLAALAAVGSAIAAAALRAAGRRFEPPLTPSVAAAVAAMVAALLLAVRIVDKATSVPGAEIKAGAPLALLALGALAAGAALAARAEQAEPRARALDGTEASTASS